MESNLASLSSTTAKGVYSTNGGHGTGWVIELIPFWGRMKAIIAFVTLELPFVCPWTGLWGVEVV